jgi:hypothetical protein
MENSRSLHSFANNNSGQTRKNKKAGSKTIRRALHEQRNRVGREYYMKSNGVYLTEEQISKSGLYKSLKTKYGTLLNDAELRSIVRTYPSSPVVAQEAAYLQAYEIYGEVHHQHWLNTIEALKDNILQIPNPPPCPSFDETPNIKGVLGAAKTFAEKRASRVVGKGLRAVSDPLKKSADQFKKAVTGFLTRGKSTSESVSSQRTSTTNINNNNPILWMADKLKQDLITNEAMLTNTTDVQTMKSLLDSIRRVKAATEEELKIYKSRKNTKKIQNVSAQLKTIQGKEGKTKNLMERSQRKMSRDQKKEEEERLRR